MKNEKIKIVGSFLLISLVLGLLCTALYWLNIKSFQISEQKRSLENIIGNFPQPPGAKKRDSYVIQKNDFVSVSYDFESDEEFKVIEKFYLIALKDKETINTISNNKFYSKAIKFDDHFFFIISFNFEDQPKDKFSRMKTIYKISFSNKVLE